MPRPNLSVRGTSLVVSQKLHLRHYFLQFLQPDDGRALVYLTSDAENQERRQQAGNFQLAFPFQTREAPAFPPTPSGSELPSPATPRIIPRRSGSETHP